MTTLKRKFWPVSNHCAKEARSLHRGFIGGKRSLSVKTSLLRSNSYAEAKGWDDLEYGFIASLKSSSLDELILLLQATVPGPHGQRPECVRPVFYNSLEEVPKLLLSMAPGAPRISVTPAHQQRLHVEAAAGVQPDGDHDGQGQQGCIDIPQEKVADRKEVEVAVPSQDHEQEIREIRDNSARAVQDDSHRHLEQEQASAAQKIQAAYRRRLKRKSVVRQDIDATQTHYWHLLRKRSTEVEWPKGSRYYLLFRVPLAYILVCLDVIEAFVESEKKEAKKRVMTEDDRGLEELMKALAQHRSDSIDHALFSRA